MIDSAARGAWRELEKKLRPFVARRVATNADADDVLQDIFLRMQHGLGSLTEEDRFSPWVYRVARSAVVDHHRRVRRQVVTDEASAECSDTSEEAESGVEAMLASYIAPFVAMLASPYREALTLTELEGLTQKQAAEMVGISLSGMKTRVQRGRRQLRRLFEDCCSIALDRRGRVMSCEPRPDGKLPACVCSADGLHEEGEGAGKVECGEKMRKPGLSATTSSTSGSPCAGRRPTRRTARSRSNRPSFHVSRS